MRPNEVSRRQARSRTLDSLTWSSTFRSHVNHSPATVEESRRRSDDLLAVTRLGGPDEPAANSSDKLQRAAESASSVPNNRRLDDTELDVLSPSISLVQDGCRHAATKGLVNRRKRVTPDSTTTLHSPSPSEVPEVLSATGITASGSRGGHTASGYSSLTQLAPTSIFRRHTDIQTPKQSLGYSRYFTHETTQVCALQTRPNSTTDSGRIPQNNRFSRASYAATNSYATHAHISNFDQ